MLLLYLVAHQGVAAGGRIPSDGDGHNQPSPPPGPGDNGWISGGPSDGPDSTSREYAIPEITVSALRIPVAAPFAASPVAIRESRWILNLTGTAVADALARDGGIAVKDYGGSGSIKTLSQRGLGAEHTLVLIDGQRINSTQNGLFDLGLLGLDEVARMEIVQGGQSASFGADAVAGVVNVITPDPRLSRRARLTLASGSAGYGRAHVAATAGDAITALRASFGREWGHGAYAYRFDDGETEEEYLRKNADFSTTSAALRFATTTGAGTEFDAGGRVVSTDRGVPGPVVSASPVSAARQSDLLADASIAAKHPLSASWTLAGSGHFLYAYERYVDPLLLVGGVPVDDFFRNRDARVDVDLRWVSADGDAIDAGIAGGGSWGDGSAVEGSVRRLQAGAFVQGLYRHDFGGETGWSLRVYPALRYDVVGGLSALSPQLGAVAALAPFTMGPFERMRPLLRVSVGRNFRAPTFNELYYSGGGGRGNPDLRPESSNGIEAGVTFEWVLFGEHALSAGYYRIAMEDRIVWVPAGAGFVAPQNLRSVLSRGLDAGYRWNLRPGGLGVELRYLDGRATKEASEVPDDPTVGNQLPYVPAETFTAALHWDTEAGEGVLRGAGATLGVRRIGYRYTTVENTDYLPGFTVVDANIRADIGAGPLLLRAKLEADNLFDVSCQTILGYPMPLRTVRFTLAAEI